jgi:ribokinase
VPPLPGPRVIVVGSVNVDLVVTVDRLPGPGETVVGGQFARHHGGKGGNQAVAAARLGVATAFVGAIGGDDLGRDAVAALRREGIDTSAVVTLPDAATGVALIVVDAAGENSIAVASGANAALTPALVRDALERLRPGAGDVVLVGHEIPTVAAEEALRRARASGALTVLNPAPVAGLTTAGLPPVDVLTPNRVELAALVGRAGDSEDLARALLDDSRQVGCVLVTLGRAGALLVRRPAATEAVAIAAPDVEAVDAVGAGDALNGALAAALASGRPLEEAARRAVVAGSLAVTRAGAREGMPTAAELEEALPA